MRNVAATVVALALFVIPFSPPLPAAEPPRERIGEAQGKPVYRDQLKAAGGRELAGELSRLFAAKAVDKYLKEHEKEVEPTAAEIDATHAVLVKKHAAEQPARDAEFEAGLDALNRRLGREGIGDAEREALEKKRDDDILFHAARSAPPDRALAVFLLSNWTLQKHLYDAYGGGRLLWQQAGIEAFDAHHRWLLDLEKRGEFQITDPALRATFYDYWTRSHGPFLIDDPERIRTEFLEAEWAPMPAPTPDKPARVPKVER